jgi:hypothetical protein
MTARRAYLGGSPSYRLAHDVGEVATGGGRAQRPVRRQSSPGVDNPDRRIVSGRLPAPQPVDHGAQARRGDDLHPRHQCRLGCVLYGNDSPLEPGGRGRRGARQDTRHRPEPAIQAELTEEHRAGQPILGHRAVRRQNRHGDRSVEATAALWQAGRRQADGDAALRPGMAAVDDR